MKYKNKKTGKLYQAIEEVINATNEQDGQIMILYKSIDVNNSKPYVREVNEFIEKFEFVE